MMYPTCTKVFFFFFSKTQFYWVLIGLKYWDVGRLKSYFDTHTICVYTKNLSVEGSPTNKFVSTQLCPTQIRFSGTPHYQ